MDKYYLLKQTIPPVKVNPSDTLTSYGQKLEQINNIELLNQPGLVFAKKLPEAIKEAQTYLKERYNFSKILIHHQKNLLLLKRDSIYYDDPFNLPINKIKMDNTNIFSGTSLVVEGIENHLVFRSIDMRIPATTLSGPQYCHELTHAIMDSNPGSVRLYNHNEIMPMLIEFIYAFESDNTIHSLKAFEIYRTYEITDSIKDLQNKESEIEASIYLVSNIIAFNLFIIYYNSSNSIRREMINNIQKVLSGYITIEEFMNLYETNFSSCLKNNNLEKHLSR